MIKIWPDSLDLNTPRPNGSYMFVDDLVRYDDRFVYASRLEDADCIMIPHYSNNPTYAPYEMDWAKGDYVSKLKKKIIMQNDGGANPWQWEHHEEIGKYIWGDWSELVRVYFSVDCYTWHRKYIPSGIYYAPFDFVGYTNAGLGLRYVPPMQTKDEFLKRADACSVAMMVNPPTRDVLWEMILENNWTTYCVNNNPNYQPCATRVSHSRLTENLSACKIGFSPYGANNKTERHLFMPSYTTMMTADDNCEFPFTWSDGYNCLKFVHNTLPPYEKEKEDDYQVNNHNFILINKEKTLEKIRRWFSNADELYSVYCNGYDNARKYELPNYFKNHIGQTVINYL